MRKNHIIICLSLIFLMIFFFQACSDECSPNGKYLVITPYAGLGNRLRILASAKIMAAISDRKLVIDWGILDKEMPGNFDDFFLNPLITYEKSDLKNHGCTLKKIRNAKGDDKNIKNLGNKNGGTDLDADLKRLSLIPYDEEPIVYFGTSLNFRPDEKLLPRAEYDDRYALFYKDLDPVL